MKVLIAVMIARAILALIDNGKHKNKKQDRAAETNNRVQHPAANQLR
jgi:hypothetical protein